MLGQARSRQAEQEDYQGREAEESAAPPHAGASDAVGWFRAMLPTWREEHLWFTKAGFFDDEEDGNGAVNHYQRRMNNE